MSDLFWRSQGEVAEMSPYSPRFRGREPVCDRRVPSGIAQVIRNGLRRRDDPADYGPPKTRYNRHARWTRAGASHRIFAALAERPGVPDRLMTDAAPPQGAPHVGRPRAAKERPAPHPPDQRPVELQAARGLRRARAAIM